MIQQAYLASSQPDQARFSTQLVLGAEVEEAKVGRVGVVVASLALQRAVASPGSGITKTFSW